MDARFSYIALQALAILGKLDKLDMDKVVGFLRQCMNFDGGFGNVPGAESHAGHGRKGLGPAGIQCLTCFTNRRSVYVRLRTRYR